MKTFLKKTICTLCKMDKPESKPNMVIKRKYITKKGEEKIYINYAHVCRECNTNRMRKYVSTKKGRQKVREAIKKSINKHKIKQNARIALRLAIISGKIIRPSFCSKCNECCKPDAHHIDYNNPLKVIFLCRPCHALEERYNLK